MKSIIHPGGFKKILLASLAGVNVRLHVWESGEHVIEDPHQHRWSFLSIPLIGKFVDVRWYEVSGDKYTKFSATGYSDDSRADHYEYNMSPVGSCGLAERERRTRYPLVPYTCSDKDIHSYGPAGEGRHVSLVITGKPKTSVGYVYK